MIQLTARATLGFVACVALVGSGVYWWGVQSQLTDHTLIAASYTLLLVLAAPSLTSFLIPWTPAGVLFQKLTARTWGYGVIIGSSLFLIYYSFDVQYSWWLSQTVGGDESTVLLQVGVGIIGFILIPALLWSTVSPDELINQIRQAHLVERYTLQAEADTAILRATLLHAQRQTLVGLANLTSDERTELTAVLNGLVTGIDETLFALGCHLSGMAETATAFGTLPDADDVQRYLGYVSDSLVDLIDDPRPA